MLWQEISHAVYTNGKQMYEHAGKKDFAANERVSVCWSTSVIVANLNLQISWRILKFRLSLAG
jgi:hypothetical protein